MIWGRWSRSDLLLNPPPKEEDFETARRFGYLVFTCFCYFGFMQSKIFHVSEEPGIEVFHPRPSPQVYEAITGHVVFGINDKLLHNYLLPRNCPRVSFHTLPDSSAEDVTTFFQNSTANFVMVLEEKWQHTLEQTEIFCYELPMENFVLLDEIAGYYV